MIFRLCIYILLLVYHCQSVDSFFDFMSVNSFTCSLLLICLLYLSIGLPLVHKFVKFDNSAQ